MQRLVIGQTRFVICPSPSFLYAAVLYFPNHSILPFLLSSAILTIGPTDVAPGTGLESPSGGDVGPRTRVAIVAVAVGVTGSGDGEGDAPGERGAGGESTGGGEEVDSADVGGHFCGLGDVVRKMELEARNSGMALKEAAIAGDLIGPSE